MQIIGRAHADPLKGKVPKMSKTASEQPFSSQILRRARAIAREYSLVIEPDAELGFVGRSLEMPGVLADGQTAAKCVAETRNAIVAAAPYQSAPKVGHQNAIFGLR